MKRFRKINFNSFYFFLLLFVLLNHINCRSLYANSIVENIEIRGLRSITEEEFLYLLGIQKGKEINRDIIREGIKRAFLKGIFEDISIKVPEIEKSDILIEVEERFVIDDVYIYGNYALSKKTIKELFQIKEGQILSCENFKKEIDLLKSEYSLRGYNEAEIKVDVTKNYKKNKAIIHLYIEAGKPRLIKKINIIGTELDIKSVMKLSEGDILNQLQFKKDIERIRTYLKKMGYFKPLINFYISDDGSIDLKITTGKKLEVFFHGNTVSTKYLKNEIPFFEAEEFNEDILEESVQRLIRFLHSKGYAYPQIAPIISEKDDLIEVHYYVYEGDKVSVRKISFQGTHIKEDNLKNIMFLKEKGLYDPDELDDDIERIKGFYNAIGYLSADIEDIKVEYDKDNKSVDINIFIKEGQQTRINSIGIKGALLIPDSELYVVIKLKKGDIYNDNDIYEARLRVIDYYLTKGFLEVSVSVSTNIHDNIADIVFNIEEGREFLFGKTIVTGNNKTRYTVIKRELQEKEEKPFDYRLITKERQNLYRLGLFSDIEVETLGDYDHKKDVLMKLKEGSAGAVELGVGYGEYERYRAMLDLSYRNLMGMNRQASIRFELSSLEKRAIFQYYEPWFVRLKLPFRVFLLTESKKEINLDTRETRYRLTRNTATAGFEKKLSDIVKAELYYEFSLVNTYDVKPDVVLSKEDTGTLIISGLRLGLFYDTRDNVFYPSRGVFSGITFKFTAPLFFSETNFLKMTLFGNIYKKIRSGLVLAGSVKGGIAQGYLKTNELPIIERFFLGGRSTVRGYDQDMLGPLGADGNPIGGNVFLMESIELRAEMGKGVGLVAFLDGGNVWIDINSIKPLNMKFTTGLGLRYNTPVGPLRVDYGIKLEKEKGESSGEIHFSIGHAF